MTTKTTPPVERLVTVNFDESNYGHGSRYLDLNARVATPGAGIYLYYPRFERFNEGDHFGDLEGLCLRAQLDDTSTAFYGYAVTYRDIADVDLHRAKAMAHTLNVVGKRLDALQTEWGYPADATDWIMRFARAVGAKRYVETLTTNAASGYYWRPIDPSYLRTHVNGRVEGWQAKAPVAS